MENRNFLKYFQPWLFGTMIGHVKINYGPKKHGCAPFRGYVLLKINFRSFPIDKDVLWKIEIF